MKPTVPELLDKLLTNGDADQIAAHLEQIEVLGVQKCDESCVIAEYLKQQADLWMVSVQPGCITIYADGKTAVRNRGTVEWMETGNTDCHEVELPDELERLANSFDRGDFPGLVRPVRKQK